MPDHLVDALRAIAGPEDSGPWMEIYREAGGGYEGLQAIARAALEIEPEYDWQAVWMHTAWSTGADMRIEVPCIDKEQALAVVDVRLSHPRYPSEEAWIERRPKIKQPPWEVVK